MALIAATGLPVRKLRKKIGLPAEQQGVSPEAFAPKSEKRKKAIRLPLSSQQPRCGEGSNNFGLCTRFQVHPSNGVSHQFSGQLEIVLPRCWSRPSSKVTCGTYSKILAMTQPPWLPAVVEGDLLDQQQRHGHQGWQRLRLALPPT